MAFKIWQIGLHLQQQEAVAVAIVRGTKNAFATLVAVAAGERHNQRWADCRCTAAG